MIYRTVLKRVLDLVLSGSALIVTGPFILAGALAVKATSPGPAFFNQTRIGRSGEPFTIYKLRTMSVDPAREVGQTGTKDPEVLAVGRILRRLKIDEMPQLFNVFKGDMSIVGPRPWIKEISDGLPDWARARFQVSPGMTGLAQVNGNVSLSWEERWQHDVHYAENCSFLLDLRIVLKTFIVVIAGEERFRRVR